MPPKFNRILIPLILILLFGLSGQILSSAQVLSNSLYLPVISNDPTSWIGPFGGSIVALAIDPSNAQIVYAGSWGSGVFKSTDGGQNWQSTSFGLTNLYINSLAIDPTHPSILYAGTYHNQVFKSQDGGNSWVWSGTGMQDQAIVYTIAIDPFAPSTIYAGTRGISNNDSPPWNGVVYKSVDAGNTWTPVLRNVGGINAQDWVYSLVVDPNAHNTIYAATHEHGPYKSSTYGDIWTSIQNELSDLSSRAIVISPDYSIGTTLFLGVWHVDTVYKSQDGGSSWFRPDPSIPQAKVYSLAIDPQHADTVYLATFTHGIMKTVDGGLSWQSAGLQDDEIYSLAINPIYSDYLLAGTSGDGLYRSVDSSSSWQHRNTGIDNAMVTSVVLSPTDNYTIFASVYGAGVYQSDNRGQSWWDINAGLGDKFVHQLMMNPSQPGLLYAMTDIGGLYQNDLNAGLGWVRVGQGLPLTNTFTPAFPADHPFATKEMQDAFTTPIETTTNSQLLSVNLLTMAFAPSDPHIAYMGTGGAGVYKSTNGGSSWQPAGLAGESILSLAVDLTDPNLVYAVTNSPGSIKVSNNGGGTWTDSYQPLTFYSLAASLTKSGDLYVGTNAGVYRFRSSNWKALGLTDQVVTSLATVSSQPNLIYAGTTSGAYYTLDAGLTWKFVDEHLRNQTIQSISLDPAIPNLVYFSTNTHGTYRVWIGF